MSRRKRPCVTRAWHPGKDNHPCGAKERANSSAFACTVTTNFRRNISLQVLKLSAINLVATKSLTFLDNNKNRKYAGYRILRGGILSRNTKLRFKMYPSEVEGLPSLCPSSRRRRRRRFQFNKARGLTSFLWRQLSSSRTTRNDDAFLSFQNKNTLLFSE